MKCPYVIKVCTKCKRILVANTMNFKRTKKGRFGLTSKCKNCDRKYYEDNKEHILEKNKMYRNEHKEERREANKKYRENNKDKIKKKKQEYYENNKENLLKYQKEYREENKDKIAEYMQWYYEENKEDMKERAKEYNKENPHIKLNSHNKRRQLENNQGKGITKEQWLEMMNFFEWKCAYSGEYLGGNSENRSVDHIIPLDKGGENEIWNLVPMLINYNSSKNSKDMEDWYIKQEFFDIDRLLKIYEWIEYAYKKYSN